MKVGIHQEERLMCLAAPAIVEIVNRTAAVEKMNLMLTGRSA